jgi:hypothetical protein
LLAAAFNLVAPNTKHLLVAEITAIFGDLGNFYLDGPGPFLKALNLEQNGEMRRVDSML